MAEDKAKNVPVKEVKSAVETMTPKQLLQYESIDMLRARSTMKNFKNSLIYIGGCLGLMFIAKVMAESKARLQIVGNGNGGDYLNLWSSKTDKDFAYNREFQRMRYLTETPVQDEDYTSDQLLHDLGVKINPTGANLHIYKKAPHPKYY